MMNQQNKNEENSSQDGRVSTDELLLMLEAVPILLRNILTEEGYSLLIDLPERRICGLKQFAFTYAIVMGIDETGYYGRYCFKTYTDCVISYVKWIQEQRGVGDPPGDWIKYKGAGGERSRIPDPNEPQKSKL